MRWNDLDQERCSVARALSVIGDRWTMMLLRDCFFGVRRFDAFQARLGVTRHILADRLRKLEREGVLVRIPYRDRPPRYEYKLTEKGLDLYPVLLSMITWTEKHHCAEDGPSIELYHKPDGHRLRPQLTCADCGEVIDPREVEPRPQMKPRAVA
jgi:DNA-binding HxlR family transcriptional regulator